MTKISMLIAALILSTAPAVAREYVDLELVMATDVSRSIDAEEAELRSCSVVASPPPFAASR